MADIREVCLNFRFDSIPFQPVFPLPLGQEPRTESNRAQITGLEQKEKAVKSSDGTQNHWGGP